jgi:hypothetical protein
MHRPRLYTVLVPLDVDDPVSGAEPPALGALLARLTREQVSRVRSDDGPCGARFIVGLDVGFQNSGGDPEFTIGVGLAWQDVENVAGLWPFFRRPRVDVADSRFFAAAWAAPIAPSTQVRPVAAAPYQGRVELWEPWAPNGELRIYYLGQTWQSGTTYGYARLTLAGPCTLE